VNTFSIDGVIFARTPSAITWKPVYAIHSIRRARLLSLGSILLAMVLNVGYATGAVFGANEDMKAKKGKIYIPLQEARSGMLGEYLTPKLRAGMKSDKIRLSGEGDFVEGYVSFVLRFNLKLQSGLPETFGDLDDLEADNFVNPETASFELKVKNIDFLPVRRAGLFYYETIELTFLENATDPIDGIGAPDLVLDDTNYGFYRDDGFGRTYKKKVNYTINLVEDMGLSPDSEFVAMMDDLEFGVLVTLRSHSERTKRGSKKYRSQKAISGLDLEFAPGPAFGPFVPEPATSAIMGSCMLVFALRRKQKRNNRRID